MATRFLPSATAPAAVLLTLVLPLFTACAGGGGTGEGDGESDGGGSQGGGSGSFPVSYTILAANDLGMHCVDKDFSVFSMLPPFNVVNAQVVRTDTSGRPALLQDGAVTRR